MELRNANIIFNKNGNGFQSNKITLPVPFVQQMGFTEKNREAIIIFDENQIIIRKKEKDMLLIKRKNFERVNHMVDFELENGILLYGEDWNGEIYVNGYDSKNEKDTNYEYKPVYRYVLENIDISKIEENSDDWYKLTEIVGFEEI